MSCKILCIAGFIFFIANVYVAFNADKTEHKRAFSIRCNADLKAKYDQIFTAGAEKNI